VYDAGERLEFAPTSESDFRILLAGAKSTPDAQAVAAQLITRFYAPFPKLKAQVVSSMVDLAHSDDPRVRKGAILHIPKLLEVAKPEVADALFCALGDSDTTMVASVGPTVVRLLKSDEEFRGIFFRALPNQRPEVQCRMVGIVRDQVEFTEDTVPQLIDVISAAFRSCVVEGLRLYGKNRKLISDQQSKSLLDGFLALLDKSLATNFDNVVSDLLPSLYPFTRILGGEATTRFLNIISEKVLPRFSALPNDVQVKTIRKISDSSNVVDNDQILKRVYDVFLTFPTEADAPLDFPVVEATLWAFRGLAAAHVWTASQLIGTILAFTGQPGEIEHVRDDAQKRSEFVRRLTVIQQVTEQFIEAMKARIVATMQLPSTTDNQKAEKKKQIKHWRDGKRMGNNCRHLTRVLLTDNPLSGRLPEAPSWQKPTAGRRKQANYKGKAQGARQDNRGSIEKDDRRRT
jgi:hypothetical protein